MRSLSTFSLESHSLRSSVAAAREIVGFSEPAEVYVVNTCTVTQVSDKKSRQLLSQAHRRAPGALIVAVGCYAETAAGAVDGLPGVGLVLGTDGRREIVRRVTDDTLPDGPVERDIVYEAPFDRCDREQDYATVWARCDELGL